ncbi:Tn7-like element transposition protein TnsE [Metasolibacillus sp. FSL K6-0083]|uniref:Tn7-like element transposition protein TnsE n=1 Tax=Metasolibacillus sp. FSL K6-0083 TaxID=2921416 RepID=UPI00315A9CB1
MKLRPWTFDKDKEVVLKWIGNVEVVNKQWRIRAAFEDNNRIEMLDFPIAALPLLRLGAFYKDGQLMDAKTTGIIYDVDIPQLNQYKVVSSLDACKEFGYYLHKSPELMYQYVFEFTMEGNTYYLPQFEFIRAVFAINKTIANSMMQPNGLEFLVKRSYLNNSKAFLELADEIPNVIVKDDNFIRFFSWLYFSSEIKASFESVYTKIKAKMNNGDFLKLEVQLPSSSNTQVRFRGIQKGNKFLILQWLGSNLEGTSFSDVEVKHKAFKKRIDAPGKRKYRNSQQKNDFENILNAYPNERSKQDANQQVENIKGTQFDFGNLADIHKVFGDTQDVNKGGIYISNQGQGGGIQKHLQQVVGLDESVYGEMIQPIEFKMLEVTEDIKGQGLEKFIKMIQLLAKDTNKYQIAMNLVYLPLGRKFSFIKEDLRRCACIVRVNNQLTNKIQYVIEIATPDNKSLSTLLVYENGINEINLKKLLMDLVRRGGSWNKDIIRNLSCEKLKHTSDTLIDWKRKLEMKFK